MTQTLYNTLTRRKEPLQTIEPGVVRLYVCGVTTYDSAHVGHAMSYLVFDTIRRWLEHRGYRVRHVQNFTDVDDKIIARANREGVSAYEIADRFAREFTVEMDRLGILPAAIYPRVSSEMPAIVAMIQRLVDAENAYAAPNGDVYFDVASADHYGALSGRVLDAAEPQESPSPHKRGPHDFALWKTAKPGEPAWDAPWGAGRPGWHIECSAMARAHLGEQIDIHGGGSDLIFPHHENEIAQSEAACGCAPFARYWVHNGLVQVGQEKMSKSLGNIVPIRAFLGEHEPEALRLFVHTSHYRSPTTLTDDAIAAATAGLERMRGAMRPAHAHPGAPRAGAAEAAALAEAAARATADATAAMDDDFGTPGALAALFALVTEINRAREAGVPAADLDAAQSVLADMAAVLGYDLRAGYARRAEGAAGGAEAAPFVELLVALRNQARADRDWALADRLRDALAEHGVVLEDVAGGGTTWRIR